ncbi:MAG: hypothetical protein F6K47_28515 [Symploca sp. SIO2E6]|nr:hypothetical protein [Symploca sp. SIO2E6]
MSYPKIAFTTLITCLGIVLTPRLLLGMTITRPELSSFAQGQSFDEIEVARQIANQPNELTEPVVPLPVPPLLLTPRPRFCLVAISPPSISPLRLLQLTTPPRISNVTPRYISSKDRILSKIALQYASIGESEQSLQTVQTIQDEFTKTNTLVDIAQLYLEAEKPQLAIPVLAQSFQSAQTIEDESTKTDNLVKIAQLYLDIGEPQLAIPVLAQSFQTAQTIESESTKADNLVKIAQLYLDIGEPQLILSQALPIVQNLRTSYQQITLLTTIALKLTEAGQLSPALQIANSQTTEYDQVNILVKIAIKLAQIGEVSRAREVAQKLERDNELKVLSGIAEHYITTGQYDQAIQLAQSVKDYCHQARISHEIVGYLLNAEQYDLALQNAQMIEYRPTKYQALKNIVITLAQTRKFDQALQIAQSIESVQIQAEALTQIAIQLVEAGQQGKASEVLSQALEMTESMNSERLGIGN